MTDHQPGAQWRPALLENLEPSSGDDPDYVTLVEVSSCPSAGATQDLMRAGRSWTGQRSHCCPRLGRPRSVRTSGPRPSSQEGSYEPWFRIWTRVPDVEVRPLVLSWSSGAAKVLMPDPGMLMTYGLVPRVESVAGQPDQVVWDEPSSRAPARRARFSGVNPRVRRRSVPPR